jgi:hypothetical protein
MFPHYTKVYSNFAKHGALRRYREQLRRHHQEGAEAQGEQGCLSMTA